jgi:predicted RNase H-like nuclease (RuvC/YqgF family)
MIKIAIIAGLSVLAAAASAQETPPSTWRDPDTRCVYLKVRDTLSLRYRRDGTPDCASVQQDSTDASITRGDLRDLTQQITRSIEELRRDVGAVRREMEHARNELENIRRETRQPPAQ